MSLATIRLNFLYRSLSDISGKAISVALNVMLARLLASRVYGDMQVCLVFAGILSVLADLGLQNLAMREVARAPESEKIDWVRAAYLVRLALWLATFALALPAAWLETREPGYPLLMSGALLWAVANSFWDLNASMYTACERLDIDARLSVANKACQAVAGLAAVLLGGGPAGALLGMSLVAWPFWIYGFKRLRRRFAGRPFQILGVRRNAGQLLKGLWPLGLANLIVYGYFKVDNLILKSLAGSEAVGLYQAVYKWFEAPLFLPVAMLAATYPTLVRAHDEGEKGRAKQVDALRLMGGSGALVCVCLYAASPLLTLPLGQAYRSSTHLLNVLCWAVPLIFPNYIFVALLITSRRQGWILLGASVALALNLGGNFLLIPRFGPVACSAMTALSEAAVFACAAITLRETLPLRRYARPAAGWLFSAAFGYLLIWLGARHGFRLAAALAAPPITAGLLWGLGVLRPADLFRVLNLKNGIKPGMAAI